MEKAKRHLMEHLKKGERVAVAVSGGRDSMTLLHLVCATKMEHGADIFVVNIDHNLRGKNSKKDSKFVEDFCAQNGIEFEGFCVDVPLIMSKFGLGVESAARKARFDIFVDLKKAGVASKLLLAHHRLDQAETVLLHMLSGSGLRGARGMEILRDGYYFRPLLDTPYDEILRYSEQHKIAFVTDETNAQNQFDRNFLRNEIFPLLEKRWRAERQLAEFARRAAADEEFLDGLCQCPTLVEDGVALSIEALSAHFSLAARHVRKGLEMLGALVDTGSKNIDDVLALAQAQNGKRICLPNGILAYKEYDRVLLSKEKARSFFEGEQIAYRGKGEYDLSGIRFVIGDTQDAQSKKGALRFDGAKIPADCKIRFRAEGDVFQKFGGGTRKLKEYLIDEKIPQRERSKIPLLVSGKNNVLAVIGHEIAESIRVEESTQEVLWIFPKSQD